MNNLKQSKTRKKATTHYCAIHKLHYFKYCPLCPNTEQMQVDEAIYELQKKQKDGDDFGELIK